MLLVALTAVMNPTMMTTAVKHRQSAVAFVAQRMNLAQFVPIMRGTYS